MKKIKCNYFYVKKETHNHLDERRIFSKFRQMMRKFDDPFENGTRERDTVYSPSYNHRDEKRRKFHDPSQNRFKNHVKNINSIVLIPLCNARRIVESIKS